MKKTQIKTYIIVVILISIVGISIAYATLSQQLQIKTNTTVQSSQTSWNIVLEPDGCSSGGNITVNGMSVTVSGITIQKPGDDKRCFFYIHNKGELDAKISVVREDSRTFVGSNDDEKLLRENMLFQWRWPEGYWPKVNVGDKILSGEKKKVEIRVLLNDEATTLPTNSVTFSSTYTINFEQA